jgi:hypothetical protein
MNQYNKYIIITGAIILGFVLHATILNKNQTPGEHCVSMIKKTDEYKNAKTLESKRGIVYFNCGS